MLKIQEYEEKYINEISNLIIQDLINVNSKDYGIERVKEMAQDFSVEKLKKTFNNRKKVFIALLDGKVVGTAGLEKSWYSNDE